VKLLSFAPIVPIALALACTAHAGTITVGVDGTFATIQAGINAAIAAGGSNQIQVEAGTYDENLTLTQTSGSLDVLGGWNSAFTQRNLDPSATQIFGGVISRVLNGSITGGQVTFTGFSFVGGTATDRGGGVFLHIANTGLAQIRNSRFVFNTVNAPVGGNALGGAFYAELFNTGDLIFDGNVVDTNSASVVNGSANGGGVFIEALDSSDASVSNCVIQNNVATASGTGFAVAGGVKFDIANAAQVSFSRNQVLSNSLQAGDANHASFSGAFVSAGCTGNCQLAMTLSKFDGNHGFAATQLAIAMGGASSPLAYLADLQISRGSGAGLQLQMDSGTANAVNLTAANNAGTGIYLVPNATITLFNSLAFGNNPDLVEVGPGTVLFGNNKSGVDPLFVDAAHANYHLQFNSPARDAGTATPPGGLGLFDLDGNPRTFGAAPDIGAFEIGDTIFKDGFQ
jgi:hypothetical protein